MRKPRLTFADDIDDEVKSIITLTVSLIEWHDTVREIHIGEFTNPIHSILEISYTAVNDKGLIITPEIIVSQIDMVDINSAKDNLSEINRQMEQFEDFRQRAMRMNYGMGEDD